MCTQAEVGQSLEIAMTSETSCKGPGEPNYCKQYVIVGGGIAGCTAAEDLLEIVSPEEVKVTLITATPIVKHVGKVVQVTRKLEDMEVVQRDANAFGEEHANLRIVQANVKSVDVHNHRIECENDSFLPFDRCLICTGAAPKIVSEHPHVVGIRDTESVKDVATRLKNARRVLVLGNGGIALEFVHEVTSCELVWAVKDAYVGNTFFDHTASGLVLPELESRRPVHIVDNLAVKNRGGEDRCDDPESYGDERVRKGIPSSNGSQAKCSERQPVGKKRPLPVALGQARHLPANRQGPLGGSLGPHWTADLSTSLSSSTAEKKADSSVTNPKPLTILFHAELEELYETPENPPTSSETSGEHEWPLYVRLTTGHTWGCDFLVSATGVVPSVDFLGPEFARGEDGGVVVNDRMQTTASPDVYAAGDCCSMTWPTSEVWFQMRLWSQARAMARYAARCMSDQVDDLGAGFAFELFAHMTRFFGFPVALLGCFNAQLLPDAEQRRLIREVEVAFPGKATQQEAVGEDQACSPNVQLSAQTRRKDGSNALQREENGTTDRLQDHVEILTRLTPGKEYVKVVVVGGRVKGAMCVGESTESAETFENLILNELDVSAFGVDLLNPDVDIDDFFD